MRRGLSSCLFAAVLMTGGSAFAQSQDDCPPGGWFCDENEGTAPPPNPNPVAPAQPAPGAETAQPGQAAQPAQPGGRQVVQAPPGSQVIIVTQGGPPYGIRPMPIPPPKRPRWRPEMGLNLRLQGVSFSDKYRTAGMGGVGASLRYRPIPRFAFDFGVDFIGGQDALGRDRFEVPISAGGLLYVNPRSRWQFYLLGGFHYSSASVEQTSPLVFTGEANSTYRYIGAQGGAGIEVRWRRFSLNFDMVGFMRGRIDDTPGFEYVDRDTGRATNQSGGGLFRLGMTFWW